MTATPAFELSGARARLEPLDLHHVPGLLAAGRDPIVWRYIPWPAPATAADMTRFVEAAKEVARTGTQFPLAIIDQHTGSPVGSTRYLDIQPQNRAREIGYTWLGVPWQRTRINTECKYLLLRHAFESLGCVRVQLKTDGRNQQSQRAIQRIGAVYEGCARHSRVMPDGFIRDTMYYSVLDSEWPGVKKHLETMLARQD